MMSGSDWWEVRRLAQAGMSQREIAVRLGINRRTVAKMTATAEPPTTDPALRGSQLDPLMLAIDAALAQQPGMQAPGMTELLRAQQGYGGSVDLVRRRLAEVRADPEDAAAAVGPLAGGAVEWDWARMRQRPWMGGVRRSVWALVASLPFSGAQTAHFSLDATLESFLEGHVRVFDWLQGVPAAGTYEHLLPVVAKRDTRQALRWNRRFRALRGHYAFSSAVYRAPEGETLDGGQPPEPDEQPASRMDGADEPRGTARDSLAQAVERLHESFWPTQRFKGLAELDVVYASWRDEAAHPERNAATGGLLVAERLVEERAALQALPSTEFDFSVRRTTRVSADGYVLYGACFYKVPGELAGAHVELHATRDLVWIEARGVRVAQYARSYKPGVWLPRPPL
jgi:transposase